MATVDGAGRRSVSFPRRRAILAFCFDTLSRAYALYEDFHRPFQGSYAPHLHSVVLAFVLQTVLEGWWIWKLGRVESKDGGADEEECVFANTEKLVIIRADTALSQSEDATTAEFIPLYIVGSVCQGSWALSWLSKNISLCRLFLTIGAVTQLYAIFALLNGSRNRGLPRQNRAVHFITKSRAALAMMLLWKTWGYSDMIILPTTTQQINNLSFLLIFAMSSGPDPTLGLLLTYVLVGLALGPYTPTYRPSTSESPSPTALPAPSTKAEAILHKVKKHVGGGGEGGWHDTFAWSAFIVFVVVIVDWLVARRSRTRRAVRMASQTQALDSSIFQLQADFNRSQSPYQPFVDPDFSDEEYDGEWNQEEDQYEEADYELVSHIQSRMGCSNEVDCRRQGGYGLEDEILLFDYHGRYDVVQEGQPSFELVIDPPSRSASPVGDPLAGVHEPAVADRHSGPILS